MLMQMISYTREIIVKVPAMYIIENMNPWVLTNLKNEPVGTNSFGCSAMARTDFLWCVRVHIVFPGETNNCNGYR